MSAILINYCIPRREKRFKQPQNPQNDFLSLEEYVKFSRRAISRYANSYVPNLAYSMLKSDDAISFVCEFIMLNDWAFGDGGGRYSILASRIRAAKWSILKYIKLSKSQQSLISLSLLLSVSEERGNGIGECESKAKLQKLAEERFTAEIERKKIDEKFEKLIREAKLSKRQEECVRLKFEDNMSEPRIAEELGISRQAVNNYIFNALYKIKMLYEN